MITAHAHTHTHKTHPLRVNKQGRKPLPLLLTDEASADEAAGSFPAERMCLSQSSSPGSPPFRSTCVGS